MVKSRPAWLGPDFMIGVARWEMRFLPKVEAQYLQVIFGTRAPFLEHHKETESKGCMGCKMKTLHENSSVYVPRIIELMAISLFSTCAQC